MVEKRTPIPVSDAIEKISAIATQGEAERVSISNAYGRYLAEDLVADHPVPLFDRSPLDGFAVRARDTEEASVEQPIDLEVVESIGAGYVAQQEVVAGKAIRIMTGAPIPNGADAIVMLELAEEFNQQGKAFIRIHRPFTPGYQISRKGEDTDEGTVIAKAGKRISTGEMAMLATFGYAQVLVYKQPIVGIFATGSELIGVDQPVEPGKIRNSNSIMLESQIRRLGATPKQYGILPDDLELCYQAMLDALQEVDYVITTGGVSVGDYDFVPDILQRLEADVLFNKVAMRPGSVTTVAVKNNKWIFGLSGNPSACYVGFELFMRPLLKRVMGSRHPHLSGSKAVLAHDLKKANPFTRFIRAKVEMKGSQCTVSMVGLDKSGVVSSLVEANALIVVQAGSKGYVAGDEVDVIWLDQLPHGSSSHV